jgi:biotin transport system ATP-binding protein
MRASAAGAAAGPPEPDTIELVGVSVDLGGTRVLDDIAIRLTQRRIAVIGANGSGKSTFARLFNALVEPTTGHVRVHGYDVAHDTKRVRERVGFVFTNPDAQILMPTVAEDVAFSLRGRGLSRSDIADRTDAVLAEYGLNGLRDAAAHSLSGGQKQLLALASVLVSEPALVVADEPTTLLDLGNARRVSDILIEELEAQTVIVTHDLELAARCEVALRFEGGHLVDSGDPASVIAEYREVSA